LVERSRSFEDCKKNNKAFKYDAVKVGMVNYWLDKFDEGELSIFDKERSGRDPINNLEEEIKSILDKNGNASARSIGKQLHHHTSTITSHLYAMDMERKKDKMHRYNLSSEEKLQRVIIGKEMLSRLTQVRYH